MLKALELYKKVKGDTKSSSYKKSIGLLKKLNDEKKKLAKEMDIAVSSKMRNVGYRTFGLKIARTLSHYGINWAFLTGVVGPILYFLISRHLDKVREKKRDKIKEVVV